MSAVNTKVVDMTATTVTLGVSCFLCGGTQTLTVEREAYRKWLMHEGLAQNLFPHLSPEARDLFFIVGTCGPCYDELMGPDPDDE